MFSNFKTHGTQRIIAILFFTSFFLNTAFTQKVDNCLCPDSYFRNNGNGQAVTVFAPNISTTSVYFLSALSSGNQGNFTFKWGTNILNAPVINRTWVTSTSGITTQNWVWGNNLTGSPFNPPGVPSGGEVKYTFYNYNLPTAGVVTLELIDPFDGSYLNTCSYPLSSGSSSTGSLTSLAVEPPSGLNYSVNNATVISGSSGNSIIPTVNAAGGTIIYSIEPQTNGLSIHSSNGVISWDGTVATGTHNFTVKASNGIAPDASTSYTLLVTEDGVGSGTNGGLESKSLGNAVAERAFNNSMHSIPAKINYKKLPEISKRIKARHTSLTIQDFMPDEHVLGKNFTGYITSPTDILSFTNAADVISVDYLEAGLNKAVAFCTKTYAGVYTHTKPVCDRLKGSELLSIDTITEGENTFLLYYLQPQSGLREYAVSFSAGFNKNDNLYTLQSEWSTDRYSAQDTMYNFQLWSSDMNVLKAMLNNILLKLNNDMPINQVGEIIKPTTYITKAERDKNNQYNLLVTIKNNAVSISGTIVISGKANEQSGSLISYSYPVSLQPGGTNIITVPLKDMAEAELRLFINGKNEDFIYNNDGTWNIYKTPAGKITEFVISNDTLQPKANEYRLFRNIKLTASTSDYITVYRMIKGGGMPMDITSYSYLKFSAAGSGNVRIRLIKKSISNYNDQFEYLLPLQNQEKEYTISLSDFKSHSTNTGLKMNDIIIASFTYEAGSAPVTINATINNVRFAKKAIEVPAVTNALKIFPVPSKTSTNLAFVSPIEETMTLQIINIADGRLMLQKTIYAVKGENQFNISLPQNITNGMYMIQLQSTKQQLRSKILISK